MSEKSALTLLFVYRAIINRAKRTNGSGLRDTRVQSRPRSEVPPAGQVATGQDQNQVAGAAVATVVGQSHAGVSAGEPEDGGEDEKMRRLCGKECWIMPNCLSWHVTTPIVMSPNGFDKLGKSEAASSTTPK